MQEVADACGISRVALNKYELEERVPKDAVKIVLAKYYKRTVQWLFFDE